MTAIPRVVLERARRAGALLLFGGSFDPPHQYHLAAPRLARQSLASRGAPAPCLYVPAARSPLKDTGPIAGDADRVAMLRAMLKGRKDAAVWTDEVDRAAWQRRRGARRASFTIDTVRRLRALLGNGVRVRLVIGADQAAAFHRWRSARMLLRLAQPIVMPREGVDSAATLVQEVRRNANGFWSEKELQAWGPRLACGKVVHVSSTRVREQLAGARRAQALRALPSGVAGVIRKKGLYRSR